MQAPPCFLSVMYGKSVKTMIHGETREDRVIDLQGVLGAVRVGTGLLGCVAQLVERLTVNQDVAGS